MEAAVNVMHDALAAKRFERQAKCVSVVCCVRHSVTGALPGLPGIIESM
jgi:hypothetical protein